MGVLVFADNFFFSIGKYLIQSWTGYIFLNMFITLTTIYIIDSKITELREK